ncbi:MAG TPA: toll/interleukin-1 receptor domain-containing protein [Ktedonobacterales bacterium]|nr:toll/interleukin-1 receptor domain-containing protein [Ktedonobacterales bacterium]
MARNGKVFISHTAQDDAQVMPLLAALKTKHVDVWYERTPAEPTNGDLTPEIQRQIEGRDVFIRILSQQTATSRHMEMELAAFQQAQALDAQRGEPNRRARINLIVDPTYERQPTDVGTLTINTTNKPESAWLPSIFSTLGKLKTSLLKYSAGWLWAVAGATVLLTLYILVKITILALTHQLQPIPLVVPRP